MTKVNKETMDKKENHPLVTITTVTLNRGATLSRAIESVLNQTYDNIEYIIKDGGSSDDTAEIIEHYRQKFEDKGYRFQYVVEEDNGLYDALNRAAELAHGELIGNVNSDDYFESIAVEEMVKEYNKSNFDLAYADLRVVNGEKTLIKHAKYSSFATTRHWNHPTSFFKREVLLKEKYANQTIYDDLDQMLRVRKKYKVVVINKVLSNFVFGGTSTKKSIREVFKRIRIKLRIYRKNKYWNPFYFFDTVAIEVAKYIFG